MYLLCVGLRNLDVSVLMKAEVLFSDLIVCIFQAIDPSEKGNHIGKSFKNENSGLNLAIRILSKLSLN